MTTLFFKKLTPIALAVFLSGCAVGPDYQEPTVSLANTYLFANEQALNDNEMWWQQFNDQTLNQMVLDVQQQNIPLKVASKRISMANSYQSIVESFKVPTVNVGAGYYNYQISQNDSLAGPLVSPMSIPAINPALPSEVTLMDNQHSGGFVGASIAWELDLFGRLDRQSNAAQIRVEQAEIMREGLNTLITADLIHNYLQYLGAQERTQLALENIEDQRETVALVEKVVRSGYGSELDYAQAKAALAITESLIPQLENAQQVHKYRLALLLGEPLSAVDIRLANAQQLPILQDIIPVGLPSDLLKRRPDIRLAEREMAAINEELAVSVVNQYPKFFLTGAPGFSASSFDDLFSSDSFGWAGGVGISWNVFDGGRAEEMIKINQANFEAAALSYQHSVDSAISEVDTTLFTYGRSQENQKQIDSAFTATEIAVNKAKSLYRAGLIDYLAVLDAQRYQRMIQDRQVASKLQTAQVSVALYKSLGGDWNVTP
ncbi:MAG: TolC family protein [Aliivibrio sp.]|uniref:efflux transporter outer membrane subunit n=1 Tax=Aliivibrio sp. TaxID=1872443 RepID=UPI001A56BB16|nr:TolC family protein [Aliivibrio sp.]